MYHKQVVRCEWAAMYDIGDGATQKPVVLAIPAEPFSANDPQATSKSVTGTIWSWPRIWPSGDNEGVKRERLLNSVYSGVLPAGTGLHNLLDVRMRPNTLMDKIAIVDACAPPLNIHWEDLVTLTRTSEMPVSLLAPLFLLGPWGDSLTQDTAVHLELTMEKLLEHGLDPRAVEMRNWPASRWRLLFGADLPNSL